MKTLVCAEARGRVRKCSILPVSIAVSALTSFGRTDATSAILTAVSMLPKRWVLEAEQEMNANNLEHDLVVEDELKELGDSPEELADMDLFHELVLHFEPYAHP